MTELRESRAMRPASRWAALALMGALPWAVAGCPDRVPEPEPKPRPTASATADVPEPPEDLVKEDQVVGQGPVAEQGDRVEVHYTGRLLENGKKFDSSRDRDQPFPFTLGAGDVIKGWDQGVVGMRVGGKRKLTIPADLAYGKAGSPPKIPPDAALVFDVELVRIEGKSAEPASSGAAPSAGATSPPAEQ